MAFSGSIRVRLDDGSCQSLDQLPQSFLVRTGRGIFRAHRITRSYSGELIAMSPDEQTTPEQLFRVGAEWKGVEETFPDAEHCEVTDVPVFELRVNGQVLLGNGRIAATD